jgi:hypothetical protein
MAKTWSVSRREQDELALESHQRVIAAQDRGFFRDLIIPLDGAGQGSRAIVSICADGGLGTVALLRNCWKSSPRACPSIRRAMSCHPSLRKEK